MTVVKAYESGFFTFKIDYPSNGFYIDNKYYDNVFLMTMNETYINLPNFSVG